MYEIYVCSVCVHEHLEARGDIWCPPLSLSSCPCEARSLTELGACIFSTMLAASKAQQFTVSATLSAEVIVMCGPTDGF